MAAILNSAILNSPILHKTLTQTNSIWLASSFILIQLDDGNHLEFCQLDSAILQRINFTHFFWLNLMMAAIFNSAMLDSATTILDSDTLLSSLRFAQKHSHSHCDSESN